MAQHDNVPLTLEGLRFTVERSVLQSKRDFLEGRGRRTRTQTNTNPNGTEASAAGRKQKEPCLFTMNYQTNMGLGPKPHLR